MARHRDGLLADAFHQAAVPGDDIGVVIHDLAAPTRAQGFLGDGKADGGGDALTQRSGRDLDPLGVAVFGVACGDRAQLAEVFHLLQRHVFVAGEVQQRIKQHGAVARRQDEAVAVEPVGRLGIEFQVLFEQHRGDIGHAHRHAGMAGIGRGHGIEGQRADRGRPRPVIGVNVVIGDDVFHGERPSCG